MFEVSHPYLVGGLLLIAGLGIRYWINSRRFRRRNPLGVQMFPSYFARVFVPFWEGAVKLIGLLFVLGGIVLILVQFLHGYRH